jgi:squalene synthase HpnD
VTALDANPADLADVERIVRAAGTSFYRGMRVLPPDRRAAMYAIYAFCRIVDDIVDEPAEHAAKVAELDAWRARIAALYQGAADDPVSRVLLPAIQRFALRQEDFAAIIEGMQMDAEHVIVAPGLAELDLYCDRVAAAVGRLSVRAFGDSSPAADTVAWALGRALQYTNILRDLEEDAQRGRLYLPREFLAAAGIPADPSAALAAPQLAAVCARMLAAARDYFTQAETAMESCDQRAMRPARLMAATYRAVLDALERRGWQNLSEPPHIGILRKLRILLAA